MSIRNRCLSGPAFAALVGLALLITLFVASAPASASTRPAAQGPGHAAGQFDRQKKKSTVHARHLPHATHQKPATKPQRSAEDMQAAGPSVPVTTVSRSSGHIGASAPTGAPSTQTLTGGGAGGSIELEEFDGALNDGPTPPDNGFGVGPNHIVQFVNSSGFIYDRTTAHTQVDSFNLSAFFGAPVDPTNISQPFYSDPPRPV